MFKKISKFWGTMAPIAPLLHFPHVDVVGKNSYQRGRFNLQE